MKTIVLIDRSTVRRNPNAGRTYTLVPGRSSVVDGKEMRQVQRMHSICPDPSHLFDYVPTDVRCSSCGAAFDHRLLESDAMPTNEGEIYSEVVCPECGAWDCCEVEFEELDADDERPEERKNAVRITKEMFWTMHGACPECGDESLSSTFIGYFHYPNEDYEDRNVRECSCGWSGTNMELVPTRENLTLLERFTTKCGENVRDLVLDALGFLREREPVWNTGVPVDKVTFLEALTRKRSLTKTRTDARAD